MTEHKIERATVLGDGSWGTALALLLHRNQIQTTLWSAFPEQTKDLREKRENTRFLPGVDLSGIDFQADPHTATKGAELVVSAIPTQYLRSVMQRFEDGIGGQVPVASATKGLEIETLKTPTQIIAEVFGGCAVCVLSGPSHAEEVAHQKPASVVAASTDEGVARLVQSAFNSSSFRVYTHGDPLGAELAAALKNVVAIAAGISDGLELGDNAKAALLTRGMVEMARYGKLHGAQADTFFGLAGFGDLVTTCCSKHSRNRAVGEAIGRGKKLPEILSEMKMVAEGVWTTKALFGPEAEEHEHAMPIAREVHSVLFEDKDPRQSLFDLMNREPAEEMQGLR